VAKKKVEMIPAKDRRQWIELDDSEMSISDQCRAAKVPRNSLYYKKAQVSEVDDAVMKAIDRIYFQDCVGSPKNSTFFISLTIYCFTNLLVNIPFSVSIFKI
jgi:hypothetical protein